MVPSHRAGRHATAIALWMLLLGGGQAPGATLPGGITWPPDPTLYDPPGTEVAPGLKIGDTLDQTNADRARDLLPPEILEHYRKGEYRNPIDSWPEGLVHRDPFFEEATATNAGKYDIDPATGAIIDAKTRKSALADVSGLPFPSVDPKDPQAGAKVVWNQYLTWWNQGSYFFSTALVWLSPTGRDRESMLDAWFQFYLNQVPRLRVPNPQRFTWQSVTNTTTPADLQGTAFLAYRYIDPDKRDSTWTYVPALRRVRAVSPTNRSDGILGSDLSQDDGNFVDMKPEDFVWKAVGIREGLRIIEPDSARGNGGPLAWVDGGIRDAWAHPKPAAGFGVPGWKGVAWAPASGALAKRKLWVVEGQPRDRYYLYGKLQLWIDTETWVGAWNRKFSWKDELLNTYQVTMLLPHPIKHRDSDEVEWLMSAQHLWYCAESIKNDRATLAGIRLDPNLPLDRRLRHNINQLFDYATLNRFGK